MNATESNGVAARDAPEPRRPPAWVAVIALSAATWATFGHLAGNDLMFDDLDTIRQNRTIASLRNLGILFSKDYFAATDEYSYRPVVTASYFLDHAIAGKRPWIYHVHNVVLHHANVLLVFALFALLGAGRWCAFAIAMVFALHPLHTSAVIFPGFREDLQMTLGMLAMACCLTADRRRPAAGWIVGAAVALGYALLAKEGALLLPVAWLVWDAVEGRRTQRFAALARRYGPLGLVWLSYIAIRFFIMTNPAAAELDVIEVLPVGQRVLTAPYLFAYYLGRFVWPLPLCIIHEVDPLEGIGTAFILSLVAVGVSGAIWIVLAVRARWLWPAGLWAAAAFAPVSNLYPIVNLWAERFYYSVGVGAAAIAVGAAVAAWGFLVPRRPQSRRGLAVAGFGAVVFLGGMAAVCDAIRGLECRTALGLWRATVRRVPDSGFALIDLAVCEIEAGNFDRAIDAATRAEPLPGGGTYRSAYVAGQAYFRQGLWREAIAHFERALPHDPPSIENQANLLALLATACFETGQRVVAADRMQHALKLDPQNPAARRLQRRLEAVKNGDRLLILPETDRQAPSQRPRNK